MPRYASRSTARIEEEAFSTGREERQQQLHSAMRAIGLDVESLIADPELRGSAALRHYTSFILPKSDAALANAEKPQRAATIAQNIAFAVREHRANRETWLRNVDRATAESEKRPLHPLIIVLDNVRSAANTGNIFRASEAARVQHVYCCGITPTPPQPKLLKTALGAAEHVSHSHEGSTVELLRRLKAEGVTVWGLETTEHSRAYSAVEEWPRPLALVLGNELIGVDTEVMRECDELVEIPMHGIKNSLNVATASTVIIFEALRRWELQLAHEAR
jgi:23S rRNA (guanosine2251-2'-O)-methyltransferase